MSTVANSVIAVAESLLTAKAVQVRRAVAERHPVHRVPVAGHPVAVAAENPVVDHSTASKNSLVGHRVEHSPG